jgi:hypothetical protein
VKQRVQGHAMSRVRSRGWVIVALALVLSGGAASASAQRLTSPIVTPSQQVNREVTPGRNHFGQQILVSPKDRRTVVIVESEQSTNKSNCPVHVSRDGGRTWATRRSQPKPDEFGACTRGSFGPSLDARFGADGTLYVLAAGAETATGTGVTDPYVARSADLGETWEFTILARGATEVEFTKPDGSKVRDTGRYNRLRLATHPTDPRRVYAGILVNPGNLALLTEANIRSLVAVSTDGGRTFGPLVDIFAAVPPGEIYGGDVPSVVVDKDGVVYAFTKERPPSPPPAPAAPTAPTPTEPPTTTTTLPPGGGCPATPARTSPPTPPTTVAVPDSTPRLGSAGAGERLLFAKSTDEGKTWTARSIDDSTSVCRFCLTTPEAAIDPSTGALYVVFEHSDVGPPTPRDDRNIFFMASTDGGETWSERIRLNDDNDPGRTPNYNQFFPGISVAPNGRIDVAWFDFRTDALYHPEGRGYSSLSAEVCWDVYYTYSVDGGATWAERNLRISDRSMNRDEGFSVNPRYDPRGPMAVAATDATTHIAWPDSRAGRTLLPVQDTYVAAVIHDLEDEGEGGVDRSSLVLGVSIGLLLAGLLVFVVLVRTRVRSRKSPGTSAGGVADPAGRV